MAPGQSGTHTLSFEDFRGCGAPDFCRVKVLSVARRWIVDIEFAHVTSFCPERSKVRFVVGCLRERARDWWEAVGDTLGAPSIEAITWSDFVSRFQAEFAPAVEVQQMTREFLEYETDY